MKSELPEDPIIWFGDSNLPMGNMPLKLFLNKKDSIDKTFQF